MVSRDLKATNPIRATARDPGYTPPMDPIALYIHWPFCLAKCPYCDFNSHVRERIPQTRFRDALRTELAWEAQRLGRRRLGSVFFGGGTPSLMEPDTVGRLLEDAFRLFDPEPDIEITLEANPTSVEIGRLSGFRDAGVNRASLGVQSLDETALRMLGRQHSAEQAVEALQIARRVFPRISFDMIYAERISRLGIAEAKSCCRTTTPLLRCMKRRHRKPLVSIYILTKSPITLSLAARVATTWPIGGTRITPGSAPARMAASPSMAHCWQHAGTARPNPGPNGWSGTDTAPWRKPS